MSPQTEKKPQKGTKGAPRPPVGGGDFGRSESLDEELLGAVNARAIAAASMEMARPSRELRR